MATRESAFIIDKQRLKDNEGYSKRLSKIMSYPAGFGVSGEFNCVISYIITNMANLNKKGAHEQKAVSWRGIGSSV